MKSLMAKNPNAFPLRSSIFWKDSQGGGWEGTGYKSTWELFKRNWDIDTRARLISKQMEYNSNFLTFYLYHYDDPNCVINPFVGCPSPAQIATGAVTWDWTEIAKWMPYITLGEDPNIWIVPTILCGDSREATNNTAFHDMFIPPVVRAIHPYIKGINIASEASKTMNVAQMERMIKVVKDSWLLPPVMEPKFVGVHWQWNRRDRLPSNADFLMYEFRFHPKDGDRFSIEEVVDEAKTVIANSPIPVLFTELGIFCEGRRARDQSRALSQLAGCYAIPGPI